MVSKKLVAGNASRQDAIVVDGRPVPVTLRRHHGARRMILRLESLGDGVVITVPPGASSRQALEFAAKQADWIAAQSRRRPATIPLRPGLAVPLRGIEHIILHHPLMRQPVWPERGEPPRLWVSGGLEHVERRLLDWLKAEARRDLLAASGNYGRQMGVRWARLTVRDTATRWGSCSTTGALSYLWRLVLAPPFVLDYVAAHEVAHLREMNHGRTFWGLVETHCARAGEARRWLKAHSQGLHRYGAT